MSKTLNLKEAATFLNMHWQTLREKVISGEIPGAKISKRWVFIEEDLVSYIRSQYAVSHRSRSLKQQNIAGGSLCYISDLNRVSGGASSPHPTDAEYKKALKLK